MTASGILSGLASAVLLAFAYLLSRRFLTECRPSLRLLFGTAHLQMGLLSLLLLPWILRGPLPPLRAYGGWLAGYTVSYLAGQWLLFLALKQADSSQVSPLLGLKIPMLALFTALILRQPVSPMAWVAVCLCTGAGLLIAPPGGLRDRRALTIVAAVCVCYCAADLCIPPVVAALRPASPLPALLGVCLAYVLAGVVGGVVLLVLGAHGGARAQAYALPYSLAWLAGMMTLFACFARIGVVYGNMFQALRGVLSVGLGALVARAGWVHLESLTAPRAVYRRAAAAVLMAGAIVLYHLTR